ncbi:MAG: hypothetical protein P1U87_18550 [Verrucomicrobiales bacterium]|nr:hypothetical protein [Verrucomicrobiales bacterium]
MKLLPYPSLQNAVPAFALVAVNVTTMGGPSVQLAAVLGVFLLCLPMLKLDLRLTWILMVAWIVLCLFLGFSKFGAHHAVIKAGKLALFCLASGLSLRGVQGDKGFPALIALRAFLGLCALNLFYGVVTGGKIFRAEHFIEFSIYSSYTIALLVYLARPYLTLTDRFFAWTFSLLCGSTMGLFVLILADLVGRNLRPRFVLAGLAATPFGFLALNFLMKARGKSFTVEYFETSDRVRLITTFKDTTLQTFTFPDWMAGVGVGRPFHEFITPDAGFDGYLHRLGEDGIYSFCLHNEALRILSDFGLIGLFLIGLRLWVTCPRSVLILLGICMMTNSYLYSFSGALIASSLFNPSPKRKRAAEGAPQIAPETETQRQTQERPFTYA